MSSSKCLEDLVYPACQSLSGSSQKDQKKEITFIFPDKNEIEMATMHKDNARLSAHNFIGGFLGCEVDVNSRIKEVSVFETPLEGFLGSTGVGFHTFVSFYVDGYYVTIEKHVEGLTIQISKSSTSVQKKHMNNDRATPITRAAFDYGDKTILQLANFIAEKNFAFEGYDAHGGIHCKKFAGEVFATIAKTQTYDWKTAETIARGVAGVAAVAAVMVLPLPDPKTIATVADAYLQYKQGMIRQRVAETCVIA